MDRAHEHVIDKAHLLARREELLKARQGVLASLHRIDGAVASTDALLADLEEMARKEPSRPGGTT